MLTTRRGLACLAFLVPAAALSGFAVVMARKIVKRGPKDYRRAELTDDGRRVRIDLDDYTKAPGDFGVFDPATEKYTRVGEVTLINEDQKYVERRIDPLGSVPGRLGPIVDWTPDVFFEPSAVGGRFEEVDVPTAYGAAPAWLFEAENTDVWVIHIHGSWTDRSIMFRDVHAFSSLGFTSLVPTFRSDPEVSPPQAESSHLGQTEWRDVESAVSYAVARGARRIILSGWSMGGTIALLTAERSAHRDRIVGVVLVGPVTSWRKTITAGAVRAGVPAIGAGLVMCLLQASPFARMLGLEEPIDFDALEWVDVPKRVAVPTLVLHSYTDQEVPWEISAAFQRANPDTVTLIPLPEAHHTQEWNASPCTFSNELTAWVSKTILAEQG
ncbi:MULTISPECIES: alpha/beta hydrolase family protein [unclassified Arthrobacter]|uniref:alpha/beta hydrolase family protein n=1 Tax=unclassified Arthrobacter TaxID=235627 RepID=UPI002E06881D|nr:MULTISPECIES: alpha/beta fold hydrolase [unclassified Arthrobacter]MEC5192654.1 pimeloyl-ACP methyl ester carboxylesterase [Arthrobacter sp. MP_M4]MEC5204138.1 pimeloyl-ACP methyl ester carboxylesterase [Arthrobacter sp. MP_M7]